MIKKRFDIKTETRVFAAFCGTGKTYLCNKFPDTYKEIECWNYRQGDFPNNYIEDIISMLGKTKYLFISTDPVILKELHKTGVEIQLIYPANELRNEYLDRFLNRESPYDFVGVLMKHWNMWIDDLKNQKYCKHLILQSGEYLEDVL